ncbi:MAG: glycosyltransferase [Ruminococcus sp.]|nr:glycosyltransferase [Ruminococcus sp.]
MSRKLRILEVNKAYFPHTGGIETLVRQYSEELGRLDGVEVKTLVCRDGRGGTVRERIDGVDLTRAGSFGTYFSCPVSLSFIRLFRKMAKKADVVHIHVPFPLADLALMLSGFRGRVVVSWHSDIVKQKKLMLFYKPFMRYLLKRADAVVTATEGHVKGSEYLPEFAEKCVTVPYGITPGDYLGVERVPFLTEKCADRESVKIFFTGRLVYYKGVEVLLRAFRYASGAQCKCELFIAGTGELEDKLKAMAERFVIAEKVHFLGFLPDEQLRQAYADCDIFVLPSVVRSEAFGIVQLEAMVYGKPVINTDLPSGVPYVSLHGKTGLTVRPNDPKQLAAAMVKLAKDGGMRERFGKAAKQRVMDVFSEKDVLERLYGVLADERRTDI